MRIQCVRFAFLGMALVFIFVGSGCHRNADPVAAKKKVIVLGFDGMDPQILRRLADEGKMPNFKRLMIPGHFTPLKTSIPPQSPVAWSNFITGMNPGGHGIFDFIHRDPSTMIPYLSTSKTESGKRKIHIGHWIIPLSGGKVTLLRQGKSFWEVLEDHHIPATVIHVPANFPPVDTPAYQLSGMGTPDIQGTYGTFSFYTEDSVEKYGEISGGKIYPVRLSDNRMQASLYGPRNSFKRGAPQSAIDFAVVVDPRSPVAKITVQDHTILLKEHEWSDWVGVKFKIIPFLESVRGICRFYLKEVRPRFKLYVTPINMDPSSPALPISTPEDYSEELSNEIGPFYTQGIPEDTKALSENILDDSEFMRQADFVYDEELKMFDYELARFKEGVLFFYIGRVDPLSHMFWRTMDPKHPAYDPKVGHRLVIEEAYRDMDAVLGKAMQRLDDRTTLMVLSDHGFAPFYRAFNLNTWLKREGYAVLRDDSEGDFLQNVDWTKTRAYGIGFNSLYLNLIGREKKGIVGQGEEREALLDEISRKLLEVRDPKTGEKVVAKMYRSDYVYTGKHVKDAPDLIVGYSRGYRASWETVLGKFPHDILRDNTGKWSGDHLMAAELVPGILLSNKAIQSRDPALVDVAPTILAEFGISKEEEMVGDKLF